LVLNTILGVIEDKSGDDAYADTNLIRSLWISQRDLQTWLMIEQAQLGALLGFLAIPIPTNFLSMTEILSILLLVTKPMWESEHLPYFPAGQRALNSFVQNGDREGVHPLDLMAGSFVIFLILLGVVGVYGIIALASQNKFARWRTTHIFLRVLQFAQPGMVVLGAYSVTQVGQSHPGASNATFSIITGFISVIFFGVIYPLAVFLFIQFNTKNLFQTSYRVQFGSLYDTYHHDKFWFGAVNLFKVSAIAMFVGFFADRTSGWHSDVASMVLPIIVIAVFTVATLVARPFIDKIRGLVQSLMLGIFDIFIFGLCIVYFNIEPFDGWAVAVGAVIGGSMFFCILMWVMNCIRISPRKAATKEVDNDYIRM